MEEKLISIIIPVYNTAKYLERCLDSVLNQTYKNLEIILVDDGSTDESSEMCDSFAVIDSRIKVIHQKHSGVGQARNSGIKIATGDYIAFVDSDDYIEKNMYQKMLEISERESADICVCQWQYQNIDGRKVIDINKINSDIFGKKNSVEFARFLYSGSYENGVVVSLCNKLYKKELFNKISFSFNYAEDECINDKINSNNYSIYVTNESLYIYCQNTSSLTHKEFDEENIKFLNIINNRIELFKEDYIIRSNTYVLYCNLCIEYYYKCKDNGIQFDKKYIKYLLTNYKCAIKESKCTVKFILRVLCFIISPKLYKKLILKQ